MGLCWSSGRGLEGIFVDIEEYEGGGLILLRVNNEPNSR